MESVVHKEGSDNKNSILMVYLFVSFLGSVFAKYTKNYQYLLTALEFEKSYH